MLVRRALGMFETLGGGSFEEEFYVTFYAYVMKGRERRMYERAGLVLLLFLHPI